MNNTDVLDCVANLLKSLVPETIKLIISIPGTLIDYWELTLSLIGLILAIPAIKFIKKLFR